MKGDYHVRYVSPFSRSEYDYRIDKSGVIVVIDRDRGGRSVTNDAEGVVQDLVSAGLAVDSYRIVYRDSDRCWGVLMTDHEQFSGYASLPVGREDDAIALAKDLPR